jgi:hypothetical protein
MSTQPKRKIDGQYVPHLRELIESPAWRALSLSGRRVLDRIEIEYLRHGGKDNGRLPVTFEDFVAYGMDRHAIAPGIRELEDLGIIEITQHGHAGNAEFRRPNHFRLNYLPGGGAAATHEWRRFTTVEAAKAVASSARKRRAAPRKLRRTRRYRKQNPSGGFSQISVGKTPTTVVGKTPTGSFGGENPHYILDAIQARGTGTEGDGTEAAACGPDTASPSRDLACHRAPSLRRRRRLAGGDPPPPRNPFRRAPMTTPHQPLMHRPRGPAGRSGPRRRLLKKEGVDFVRATGAVVATGIGMLKGSTL